jgi:hypothetical protein
MKEIDMDSARFDGAEYPDDGAERLYGAIQGYKIARVGTMGGSVVVKQGSERPLRFLNGRYHLRE